MGQPMTVSAWASFDGSTAIQYTVCGEGDVELVIGGASGFNLHATDAGLERLASVIDAARRDARRLRHLAEPDYEE
jgi:hypothetical protein